MSEFTINVVVGGENQIIGVESPKGLDYLSFAMNADNVNETYMRDLILICTELEERDIEKMGPRSLMKTLNACGYALQDNSPENEDELLPEDFGEDSVNKLYDF